MTIKLFPMICTSVIVSTSIQVLTVLSKGDRVSNIALICCGFRRVVMEETDSVCSCTVRYHIAFFKSSVHVFRMTDDGRMLDHLHLHPVSIRLW